MNNSAGTNFFLFEKFFAPFSHFFSDFFVKFFKKKALNLCLLTSEHRSLLEKEKYFNSEQICERTIKILLKLWQILFPRLIHRNRRIIPPVTQFR